MKKPSAADKKRLKELNGRIKELQIDLVQAQKREGKDEYIAVRVKKNQGRFKRITQKGVEDKAMGNYYIEIDITAKQHDVFVPLSIASGKKTAGFMYQIEGTAAGSIVSANVRVSGKGVTQVTVGTLLYAKVPAGTTALFEIRSVIRGAFGKVYTLVFTRLNYKLNLADARYQQYLKEIPSKSITFS